MSGSITLRGTYEYRLLLSVLALAAVGAILVFLLFRLHRWREADAKRRGEEYFNLCAWITNVAPASCPRTVRASPPTAAETAALRKCGATKMRRYENAQPEAGREP